MSLRVFEKQSPVSRGDCFATCARNDRCAKVNALCERWLSRASALLARIETTIRERGETVRTVFLESKGYRILRFWNSEISSVENT